jgi:hypothetical protein
VTDDPFTSFGFQEKLISDRWERFKMKITIDQKAAYKAYRAECLISNVLPLKADFLAGDFPNWMRDRISKVVIDQLSIPQPIALTELENAAEELHQAEYRLYHAACRIENTEPVLADFLAGEIPDGVVDIMERQQNGEALAFAASAGR